MKGSEASPDRRTDSLLVHRIIFGRMGAGRRRGGQHQVGHLTAGTSVHGTQVGLRFGNG